MAYGLQVYNNSGILQIDSSYRNFAITTSGVAVAGAGGLVRRVNISVVGENPILGFRSSTGATATAIGKSGSTFTYQIMIYAPSGGFDPNVYWWAFDNESSPVLTHGLHVYNSSGGLCYDSGKRYFKMLNHDIAGSITYTGKALLSAACSFGYARNAHPNPANPANYQYTDYMEFVKINGSVIEKSTEMVGLGGWPGPLPSYSVLGTMAAIDVTGYGI